MSNQPSRYESALRAMMWLMRAELAADSINDFGELSAIQDDLRHIQRDAENAFSSIERRSWDLVNRCDKLQDSVKKGGSDE